MMDRHRMSLLFATKSIHFRKKVVLHFRDTIPYFGYFPLCKTYCNYAFQTQSSPASSATSSSKQRGGSPELGRDTSRELGRDATREPGRDAAREPGFGDPEAFRNNSIACLRAKAQEHQARLLSNNLLLQVLLLFHLHRRHCSANVPWCLPQGAALASDICLSYPHLWVSMASHKARKTYVSSAYIGTYSIISVIVVESMCHCFLPNSDPFTATSAYLSWYLVHPSIPFSVSRL